jgi:alkylation response protein AidB-like acyl-CoA dehydrogenase
MKKPMLRRRDSVSPVARMTWRSVSALTRPGGGESRGSFYGELRGDSHIEIRGRKAWVYNFMTLIHN